MGVNKVILLGHLGRDPEVKLFDKGSLCNVTLATSAKYKDRTTGEQRENTQWHRLVFNGRSAEIAAKYLRKGAKIYVEGKLNTRKWTNQLGQEQYTTEIKVNSFQMLDSKEPNPGTEIEPESGPVSAVGRMNNVDDSNQVKHNASQTPYYSQGTVEEVDYDWSNIPF